MFKNYLSKSERIECIKLGALSYAGFLDATEGPLVKESEGSVVKGSVDAAKTLWVLAAAGAGIPLGVFAHIMGRRISGKRLREEELNEKIRAYRMAADEMASGLMEDK